MTASHLGFPSSCYVQWTGKNTGWGVSFIFQWRATGSLLWLQYVTLECLLHLPTCFHSRNLSGTKDRLSCLCFSFAGFSFISIEERSRCRQCCCQRAASGWSMQNHPQHSSDSEDLLASILDGHACYVPIYTGVCASFPAFLRKYFEGFWDHRHCLGLRSLFFYSALLVYLRLCKNIK